MLSAFRACGYIKHSQLREELNIANTRIKNFVRDGYLEKCSYLNVHTHESFDVYRLSDDGRKFCNSQLNMTNFYRSSSAEHDLHVSDRYFSLSVIERDSWRTEADLRDDLRERYPDRLDELQQMLEEKRISSSDGAYTEESSGSTLAVEIVTRNYNDQEVEAKQEFARELNVSLDIEKV
ncbi:hypothetical protein ACOTVE_09085 [Campylobacter jejuni]|uniref:hypothetical protein n=1 Tax=Campylobacter jejuni TaxID=197 RepID=UPI003BA07386